jgi:hypothetical protein
MGIDYETGTTFYERFDLKIQPSDLFPRGLDVEIVPWSRNCFNITKITSYNAESGETRYYKLNTLTDEQQKFIRDVLAKHYIRHRQFMQLTEGDFAIQEDVSKYWLYMNDLSREYTYRSVGNNAHAEV